MTCDDDTHLVAPTHQQSGQPAPAWPAASPTPRTLRTRGPYRHHRVIVGVAVAALAVTGLSMNMGSAHSGGTNNSGVSPASAAGDKERGAVEDSISREAEAGGKAVNITLDDGPDPTWTPKALDLLKKYDVKAVFCMVGPNAAAHPDVVKQIVAAGHRLCDHTVDHDTAMDKKPVSYQQEQIQKAYDSIVDASEGVKPMYYRAPGGAFTPESRTYAAEHGMRPLGWRIDPSDFKRPGVEEIVKNVEDGVKAGHQTILMHDGGGDRSQTLQALEVLLPWLKEQGRTFSFPKA